MCALQLYMPPKTSLETWMPPGPLMVRAEDAPTAPAAATLTAVPPRQGSSDAAEHPALVTPGVIRMPAVPLSSICTELGAGYCELVAGLGQSAGALQTLGRIAVLGGRHVAAHVTHKAPGYVTALREQCTPAQAWRSLGECAMRVWVSQPCVGMRRSASARLHKYGNKLYPNSSQ